MIGRLLMAACCALVALACCAATASARWETQDLMTPGWGPTNGARSTITSEGDAIAAWDESDGASTYRTMLGVWPRSGGGSTVEQLAVPGTYVALAADTNGGAIVMYLAASDGDILWRERPAGGAFGPSQSLGLGSGGQIGGQSMAVNARGDLAFVWCRNGSVHAAVRPAGGSFGAPQTLAAVGPGDWCGSVSRLSDSGELVVAWKSAGSDQEPAAVRAVHRRADGQVSSPQTLSSPGMIGSLDTLAMDSSGRALLAWHEQKDFMGSYPPARMAIRDPGGDFRDAPLPSTLRADTPPAVSITGGGLVTLARPSGFGMRVYSGQIGSPLRRIHTFPGNGLAQLTSSRGGRTVMAWEFPGGRWVTAQREGAGAFGPTEDLVPNCDGASWPDMHIDDAGRTVATWGGAYGAPSFVLARGDAGPGHQGCLSGDSYSGEDLDNPAPHGGPGGGAWTAGPRPGIGPPPPARTLPGLKLKRPRLTGSGSSRLLSISGRCGELCYALGTATVTGTNGRSLRKDTLKGAGFDDGKVALKHRIRLPRRLRAKLDGRPLTVVVRLKVGDRWNRRKSRTYELRGAPVER